MQKFALGLRFSVAVAVGVALVAAGTFGGDSTAFGQDMSAATAKDVIFARKVLMGSIAENMDDLDIMVETDKIDLPHGAMHADVISVLLLPFPHLFPPHSNEWKPGVEKDAGIDTFASPDVWIRYSDFYQRSADASKIAYNASRARNAAEFKKYAIELRAACDGCHATYQKKD